jgi:hypothetical protein
MGLFDRFKKNADKDHVEFERAKELETAKVRAFRTADEMATASQRLMNLALELRKEIEAIESD